MKDQDIIIVTADGEWNTQSDWMRGLLAALMIQNPKWPQLLGALLLCIRINSEQKMMCFFWCGDIKLKENIALAQAVASFCTGGEWYSEHAIFRHQEDLELEI